jgi:cobalt-zinc-cadmium efflux system protein
MAHQHGTNEHLEARSGYRRMFLTLGIVLVVMVAEVIGGLISGSLSLLGDAGHMLVDALALGLGIFAMSISRRPATATRTFGYYRVEILVALANGVILVLVAAFIIYEAYHRILEPPTVKPPLMLIIAAIGLVANLSGVLLLNRVSHGSLNIKAAFWHVIGDTISSVGVIAAGIIILLTDWYIVDPIVAIVIGVIILLGAVRIVREAGDILLEAAPGHFEMDEVIEVIKDIPGVKEIHDVHAWTITSNIYALSAHLVIEDQMVSKSVEIVTAARKRLAEDFSINHTTLQLECGSCPTGLVCELDNADSPDKSANG